MDKNQLKNMLDLELSMREIGKRTNKSLTTIRYWCKKYGFSSKWTYKRTWSKQDLENALSNSSTLAECLRKLRLDPRGANYRSIKREIERLGLSTDHLLGSRTYKDKPSGRGRPLEEYLQRDGPCIGSSRLKKRLLRECLIKERCDICSMEPIWNGNRLVLRLDHINGVNTDNRKENLRLLCPNCDSQQSTYCSRNIVYQNGM